MKKRRIKVKYKNIGLILLGLVFLGVILTTGVKLLNGKEKSNHKIINDFKGMVLNEVKNYGDINHMTVLVEYQYNSTVLADHVIKSEVIGDTIKVIVSKGQLDETGYRQYKVNELGRVPIMMYHGIIDTTETNYIGGNVDKDGYNRTATAFRHDLEFYYQSGYRMVRLIDYVNGKIDVELGYSPIVLTFDDGNKNNFHVLGKNSDGTLQIDPNCAVGILEEFKQKYPDFQVTATFFVMANLFNQKEYNEEIMHWLVDHGYDIGNHTTTHPDFTKITTDKAQEVVGKMYQKLDNILKDQYVNIVALPFGSPYKKSHSNYPYVIKGSYNGYNYETLATLRVGWESEISPFNKNFDKSFLKRCRAYDNNGKEFDIQMVFKNLEKNRYISDGDMLTVVVPSSVKNNINDTISNIIVYEEE